MCSCFLNCNICSLCFFFFCFVVCCRSVLRCDCTALVCVIRGVFSKVLCLCVCVSVCAPRSVLLVAIASPKNANDSVLHFFFQFLFGEKEVCLKSIVHLLPFRFFFVIAFTSLHVSAHFNNSFFDRIKENEKATPNCT